MRFRYSDLVGEVYGKFKILSLDTSLKDKEVYTMQCLICNVVKERRCDVFRRKPDYCWHCEKNNKFYKSNTYNSWDGMLQRCNNKNSASYYKYGAIGIDVEPRWCEADGKGFKNFLEDMGECPNGLTLDRIDGTKGYSKENCRWATNSIQGFNQKKRNTNTSGRTGVSWAEDRGKWAVSITFNSSTIHLGRYSNFELAVHIREEAELKYFGYIKE